MFERRISITIAILMTGVIFLIGGLVIPGFGTPFSVRSILMLSAFLGVAAVGQTMVVVLGGIDLSIPFIVGFANVVAAKMTGDGYHFLVTLLTVLVICGAIGVINGATSMYFDVHPLIITLGVGNIVQGAVLLWTEGFPTGGAPPWLSSFVSIGSAVGPIPLPPLVLLWGVIAVGVLLLERRTVFGRQMYALGSNREAARLALVRPIWIWAVTFGISGIFSGVAGILLLGFTGSAFGDVGSPYLFLTVAAVVVGGTSLLGGRGGYGGTIIGVLMLTELTTVMVGLGYGEALQQAILGVVIAMLVSVYGREMHVRYRV